MRDLNNKICLVTGASSGIGESLVIALKKEGARIVLASRRIKELERVQREAGLDSKNSMIVEMDLKNPNSFPKIIDSITNKMGPVDVLFNNGGISQRSSVLETDLSVYREIMEVNFFSNIALTALVLPSMIERNTGAIVITSSIVGKVATQLRSGYSASKHALHGYYDALRLELNGRDIQILNVMPGFVKTNVSLHARKGDGSEYGIMDDAQLNGISALECSTEMIKALKNGESEVIIAGFKEHLAVGLKRFAPDILNHLLKNTKVT